MDTSHKYSDVYDLKSVVKSEFNIEGNPNEKFIKMVLDVKPTQVTLVPDAVNDITFIFRLGYN